MERGKVVSAPAASKVKEILSNPLQYDWSIQGLGMLRTYLDPEGVDRLHIWDISTAKTFNENGAIPSTIHDHPWDFTSVIYSGRMGNLRFQEVTDGGEVFRGARIRCGVGGGIVSQRDAMEYDLMHLDAKQDNPCDPGDSYHQFAEELHESYPSVGAVTVITREFKEDRDHARVFWRQGDWVSAEPRPATIAEIEHFTGLALRRWNG
jgi:hypothetical protein